MSIALSQYRPPGRARNRAAPAIVHDRPADRRRRARDAAVLALVLVLGPVAACRATDPSPDTPRPPAASSPDAPQPSAPSSPLALEPAVHAADRTLIAADALAPLSTPSTATLEALRPSAARRDRLAHRVLHAWDRPSLAAALTRPVTAARIVRDRGTALTQALAAFPEERRALGAAALTLEQTFGGATTTPLCEAPMIDLDLQEHGETFEARYRADPYIWFTAPVPALYALSSTCTGALLASGGTIANAVGLGGCTPEDEAAHFPANSACRACLSADGDHARCIAAGSCKPEMTREMAVPTGNQTQYFDVLESVALACAPDYTANIFVLAQELGEDNRVPEPFDHDALVSWCQWLWNPSAQQEQPFCIPNRNAIHLAFSDVVLGWVEYIRRPGDTNAPYKDRLFTASAVEVDAGPGVTFEMSPLMPGALAEVSTPMRGGGGWGYSPRVLRPDGTDPLNVDHTYARDWIGAVGMKTSTRVNGVPIVLYNRNICTAEMWQGPDTQGRYFCRLPYFSGNESPPDPGRWSYDWGAYLISSPPDVVITYPMLTLAATGHMDPNIPGGHLPQILGSPVLADPDWDGCAWPQIFMPDELENADTAAQAYTFTSQSYRFGKDPRTDVRIVLATNWRRNFCFEALSGN